jgi:aspartyl protease family protein
MRHLVWIGLIVAGGLGIWELSRLFPGALSNTADQGYFLRLCVMVGIVASGIAYSRRFTARETVRNIAIWAGIAAVLIFGYTFYHQIQDAAVDARAALTPGYPVAVNADTIVLNENADGDFIAIGEVNGTTVKFLVDTGASDIVLSPDDAARIGIDLSRLSFTGRYETANGEGRGARYTVDRLQIGPVKFFDVPVSINQAKMSASLLGMAFLKRMKSFEMKGRKLTLRWR